MVECNIQITEAALFYCHTGGKKTENIHAKKLDSANVAEIVVATNRFIVAALDFLLCRCVWWCCRSESGLGGGGPETGPCNQRSSRGLHKGLRSGRRRWAGSKHIWCLHSHFFVPKIISLPARICSSLVFNAMFLCRGRRELVIRLLSRPLRVEVERVSAKSKVLKTLQLSLDRFVLCCVDFFLIWAELYAVEMM